MDALSDKDKKHKLDVHPHEASLDDKDSRAENYPEHPEIKHGDIKVCFTPDIGYEEIFYICKHPSD